MNPANKRQQQLAVGFAVLGVAVIVSYFSVVDVSPEQSTQDIMLVIDVSGSMEDESKLRFAQNAANTFVDNFYENATLNHRIGLIAFSNTANIVTGFDEGPAALKSGISSLVPEGGTAMGDGIAAATKYMSSEARHNATKTVVLLSDGASNDGMSPHTAAQNAANNQIILLSIGYGSDADILTLKDVASITGGEYFSASNVQDLGETFEDVTAFIISPISHYSSRIMILVAIPILLFMPAIDVGITSMLGRRTDDMPVRENISKLSCFHCGHLNRSTAEFCAECGRPMVGRS